MQVSIKTICQILNDNKRLIANAISFQIVWFICVQGNSLYAFFSVLLLLGFYHLIFNQSLKVWKVLIAFSLVGYLGDGLIAYLFQLNYSVANEVTNTLDESNYYNLLAPLWLLGLWFAFATTLNHSMLWIFRTSYLAISIALFLVPLSYFAGIHLSDSFFSSKDELIQAAFFLTEGLWWAILLIGYKKIALSHSNSVTHYG